MYEYKVRSAKDVIEAEQIMNSCAKQGWKLFSVTLSYQINLKAYLVITFERER